MRLYVLFVAFFTVSYCWFQERSELIIAPSRYLACLTVSELLEMQIEILVLGRKLFPGTHKFHYMGVLGLHVFNQHMCKFLWLTDKYSSGDQNLFDFTGTCLWSRKMCTHCRSVLPMTYHMVFPGAQICEFWRTFNSNVPRFLDSVPLWVQFPSLSVNKPIFINRRLKLPLSSNSCLSCVVGRLSGSRSFRCRIAIYYTAH